MSKNTAKPSVNPPVNLVVPRHSELRMEAIVELSRAIHAVAKALASPAVTATISYNAISNCGQGITIEETE